MSENERRKRKRRKYPNVFYKKELVTIFNAIEDAKTAVACFLTFFCALRMSETCELKWINIDLDNKRLKVVDGKCHKDGYVPISSACIPILRRWRAINPNQEYFLPPEENDVPFLRRKGLSERFRKALRKAGLEIPIEKNSKGVQQHQYKFHTLRHSRCTHLINNGVPIQKVQYFMRHDRIDTTMIYTWITNPELHQMVEDVDSPQNKSTMLQNTMSTNYTETKTYTDPVEIARRRYAFGEISTKEFRRMLEALQTPISV